MLDHVAIPVSDVDASRRFYEPVLDGLGVKVVYEAPGFVLFGNDDGFVGLRQKEQVLPIHLAFRDRSSWSRRVLRERDGGRGEGQRRPRSPARLPRPLLRGVRPRP